MITYRGISKEGERPRNEDSIAVFDRDNARCFILCDGLGGHGKGDIASKLACQTIGEAFEQTAVLDLQTFFIDAIPMANAAILRKQQEDNFTFGMKTTLVALILSGDRCVWAHIGDSRLYMFRDNEVSCRTMDHSVPQMLVNSGSIKEKDIRFHPDRNRLLRALGNDEEDLRYEISPVTPLNRCQAFLLCSDGFWEYIDEKQMCKALSKSTDATDWMKRMRAVVEENGQGKNMDNFSAITVYNDEV